MEQPSEDIARLATRRDCLEAQLKATRAELANLIRADANRGVRQVDLVTASRYTREQIRRICSQTEDAK